MVDKDDDEEEINEGKIKNKDILTEDEVLETIDMTTYKERIENILGRNYSYLFFGYFDNYYYSKTKNKISEALNQYLKKKNQIEDSLWMNIYKSIKFYSKEKIPILITKYFSLKAEIELKFIYNESKKYTNKTNKFIDVYIKKMKKYDNQKFNDLKLKNAGLDNVFNLSLKSSTFIRNFMNKKSILKSKKSTKTNLLYNNNEEAQSDSSTKEEEIKHKRQVRTQIMKQIRQLKINTMKEVEKANNLQSKQKKKYGGIKSRFLDAFNKQQKLLKLINFTLNKKINNNIINNFNSYKEDELSKNSIRKKSDSSSKFSYSKKNSKLLTEEKSNNSNNYYYLNTLTLSNRKERNNYRNILRNNKTNYEGSSKYNYSNKSNRKVSLFTLDFNYKNSTKKATKTKNLFKILNKNGNDINKLKLSANLNNKYNLRPKSSLIRKKADTKLFLNKLEKKRNKEFLDNLLFRKNTNDVYSNKIYELFKKTQCY